VSPAAVSGDETEESATVLARAVPTDIIVFYTTIVGLLEGIEKDSDDSYLPLRWFIYGITLTATVAAITVAAHFARREPAGAPPPALPVGPPLPARAAAPSGNEPPEAAQPPPPPARPRWWRRWAPPVAETATATFAFAVWGLITPGSPVYAMLDSPVLPITVGILTAGGALVMSILFAPILSRPAQPRS
jgi:hypothetical protein